MQIRKDNHIAVRCFHASLFSMAIIRT
jgi:hypothetical protein